MREGAMSSYGFEDSGEPSVRISGHVKWFDVDKGYGFIVPDQPELTDRKDVLLHVTSLRGLGRELAPEGASLSCSVVRRPKGWQVSEIHDFDESTAQPRQARDPERGDYGLRRDRDDYGQENGRNGYDRGRRDGFQPRNGGTDRAPVAEGPFEPAKVKWFNRTKGYGFVQRRDDPEDIFIHMVVVRKIGIEDLQPGQTLLASVGKGQKGRHIVSCRLPP
jgi:CspA family cold shock protein